MEEPKKRELVIYGECAKCKNLVRIDITLKTALANEEQEEKPEEAKKDAGQEKPEPAAATDKGASVRPDSAEGGSPEAGAKPGQADSATAPRAKKARGK